MYPIIPPDPCGAERAAVQEALGLLEDTADSFLDSIADRARHALGGVAAGVNIVGGDLGQFFIGVSKADVAVPSIEDREMPGDHGYCVYVVAVRKRPLIVQDVYDHAPFASNPVVDKADVRAYAGVPFKDDNGQTIATLWVTDDRPRRDWNKPVIGILNGLAAEARPHLLGLAQNA